MVKNLPAKAGDTGDEGSIPGSGTSPGEENGNPLQYTCLENSTDRGDWRAIVRGVTELDITEQQQQPLFQNVPLLPKDTFKCQDRNNS